MSETSETRKYYWGREGFIPVEPFPEAPKAAVKGGVLQPMNQGALVRLAVLFPTKNYYVGQAVYVRSKLAQTSLYARDVFEVDGKRFILIPEDEVILADQDFYTSLTWNALGKP